jgi:hypothetical protein
MKSSVTNAFRKKLDQLPASVQEQAAKAYALWHSDPTTTAFSLNELVSVNLFIQFALD